MYWSKTTTKKHEFLLKMETSHHYRGPFCGSLQYTLYQSYDKSKNGFFYAKDHSSFMPVSGDEFDHGF